MTVMGDEVMERRRGVSRVVKKLDNEDDRVQALHEYLGIELTDVQKRSILGTVSQLRSSAIKAKADIGAEVKAET